MVPTLRKRVQQIPIRGLPPGLSRMPFARAVDGVLEDPLQRVVYRHISHWKEKGAYRITVHGTSGVIKSLVFKDADYRDDDLPALRDLCIRPGPPEYQIYAHCSKQLREYVPHVYHCACLRTGTRYHFLLEDEPLSRAEPKDLRAVVSELPNLHRSLKRAIDLSEVDESKLIDYGLDFKKRLPTYAIRGIAEFAAATDNNTARLIRDEWSGIETVYSRHVDGHRGLLRPIHGDANLSNVLTSSDSGEIKFIDWEWAGIGLPQWDLASVLKSKSVDDETEEELVGRYYENSTNSSLSRSDNLFLFRLCKLEQAMLGASFLIRQFRWGPTISGEIFCLVSS